MEIKAMYNHSKAGQLMFNICAAGTKFMVKHRGLYYLLATTGGIIMTVIGLLITAVLALVSVFTSNISFKTYYGIYAISVGPEYGGGFEMGLMFCRDQKSSSKYLDTHEFGHTFQNTLLGPLFPFLVSIPSATRYGIQTIRENKGKNNPPYDSIGFEDSASQCGLYAADYIQQKR